MEHEKFEIGPRIIIKFGDSGVYITETVLFSIIVAAVIAIVCIWSASKLTKVPSKKQVWAELVVESLYKLVQGTMGKGAMAYAPYIGTLFLFLLIGSMLGLLGIRPITADVNTAFAMSGLTFILVQSQAIRSYGVVGKLKEMCHPYPFMFPLKIIEQVSFPISLAFRNFGNILGGFIVLELAIGALRTASENLHLPIPLLVTVIPLPANFFFDMFEPVLQSFIFIMLTMVFISMEIVIQGEDHS